MQMFVFLSWLFMGFSSTNFQIQLCQVLWLVSKVLIAYRQGCSFGWVNHSIHVLRWSEETNLIINATICLQSFKKLKKEKKKNDHEKMKDWIKNWKNEQTNELFFGNQKWILTYTLKHSNVNWWLHCIINKLCTH